MDNFEVIVNYSEPGPKGDRGWTPVFAFEFDGDRLVQKLVDYTGGNGNKPTQFIGQYVGDAGYVLTKAAAVSIRGLQGIQGFKGWAPAFAAVADGLRYVMQLKGYVGGTGAEPTENVGMYLGPTGYVSNIAQAVDLRGIQGIQGIQGFKGWSPVFSPAYDGDRVVMRLTDYSGGAGDKPTDNIGQYLATAGYTSTIAQALDFRGLQGIQGFAGWTPQYGFEADGNRVIAKLINYVGGTGTKPTANIGQYLKADATFTTVKGDALDFRGPQGIQGFQGWSRLDVFELDGVRYLKRLSDYIGGQGAKPTQGIGQYYKADGTLTDVKADAMDFRGLQGPQGVIGQLYTEFVDFTANKTLTLTDQGKMLRGLSATDLTVIIPADTTENLPVGFPVMVKQQGDGRILFNVGDGVTLQSPYGRNVTSTKFAQARLVKEGPNRWSLEGTVTRDLVQSFANAATAAGTFDRQLVAAELSLQTPIVLERAKVLLIPGSYKTGTIYGINPVTGDAVPFSFSRAGTATYFDKNGVLQTASANVPRIDFDPDTKALRGYLIEPSTSNLYNFSENFAQSRGANGLVVTSEAGINNPTGQAGTYKMTQGSANYQGLWHTPGTYNSGVYTWSMFVKKADQDLIYVTAIYDQTGYPAHAFMFNFANETLMATNVTDTRVFTNPVTRVQKLPNGWYRLQITETITFGATFTDSSKVQFRVLLSPGATVTAPGSGVYVWGEQFEAGAFATSYVPTPTVSQATRAIDFLTSATADIMNLNTGSLYAEHSPLRDSSVTGNVFYISNLGAAFCYSGAPGILEAYDGTNYRTLNSLQINGSRVKTALTFGGADFRVFGNGQGGVPSPFTGAFGSGVLRLHNPTAARLSKNHIKALVIFSEKLTDAEIQALTTL